MVEWWLEIGRLGGLNPAMDFEFGLSDFLWYSFTMLQRAASDRGLSVSAGR